MLDARHLVKRFFGTAVVSDVSFEVRAPLVLRVDPERTAADIADVVTDHA